MNRKHDAIALTLILAISKDKKQIVGPIKASINTTRIKDL